MIRPTCHNARFDDCDFLSPTLRNRVIDAVTFVFVFVPVILLLMVFNPRCLKW